jgi:hypothetical protein
MGIIRCGLYVLQGGLLDPARVNWWLRVPGGGKGELVVEGARRRAG